jgi:hypothetical protein
MPMPIGPPELRARISARGQFQGDSRQDRKGQIIVLGIDLNEKPCGRAARIEQLDDRLKVPNVLALRGMPQLVRPLSRNCWLKCSGIRSIGLFPWSLVSEREPSRARDLGSRFREARRKHIGRRHPHELRLEENDRGLRYLFGSPTRAASAFSLSCRQVARSECPPEPPPGNWVWHCAENEFRNFG